jgi:hypothetical protein
LPVGSHDATLNRYEEKKAMDERAAPKHGEIEKIATTAESSTSDSRPLGSVEIQIREVDVSWPTRSVNRMWPNR